MLTRRDLFNRSNLWVIMIRKRQWSRCSIVYDCCGIRGCRWLNCIIWGNSQHWGKRGEWFLAGGNNVGFLHTGISGRSHGVSAGLRSEEGWHNRRSTSSALKTDGGCRSLGYDFNIFIIIIFLISCALFFIERIFVKSVIIQNEVDHLVFLDMSNEGLMVWNRAFTGS